MDKNNKFPNKHVLMAFSGDDGEELWNFAVQSEIEKLEKAAFYFEKLISDRILADSILIREERASEYLNLVSLAASINPTFQTNPVTPQVGTLVFWKYLQKLSVHEKELIAPYLNDVTALDLRFQNLLYQMKNNFSNGMNLRTKSLENFVWYMTDLLTLINKNSTIFDLYIILSAFMTKIEILVQSFPEDEEKSKLDKISFILHFCTVVYDAKWLLKTAVFLQRHMFGSKKCYICPYWAAEQWNQFFTAFLNLISNDPVLLKSFTLLSTGSKE